MEPIPLPSHIHYELILQLLERQTMVAVSQNPALRAQVNQLIITLRKAAAQQKHIEESCQQSQIPVEQRWSLNHHGLQQVSLPNYLPLGQEPPVSQD